MYLKASIGTPELRYLDLPHFDYNLQFGKKCTHPLELSNGPGVSSTADRSRCMKVMGTSPRSRNLEPSQL